MFMNEEVESISDFLKLSLTVTDKLPFSGNVSGDCRLKFLRSFWTLSHMSSLSEPSLLIPRLLAGIGLALD